MMTDDAHADCIFLLNLQSGDTGMRGVEHRDLFELWFTHNINCKRWVS
jgi:hypothetical protein